MAVLWKYRSLKNMEFVVDIFAKNRMYLGRFDELNDPMEGAFISYGNRDYAIDPSTRQALSRDVIEQKRRLGILSLSKEPRSLLMWSHYADGGRGIAIGINVKNNIHKVKYTKDAVILAENHDPEVFSRYVLTHKYCAWKYEKEWRVIKSLEDDFSDASNENRYFEDFEFSLVLLGPKITESDRSNILECLQKFSPNTPVSETDVVSGSIIEIRQ